MRTMQVICTKHIIQPLPLPQQPWIFLCLTWIFSLVVMESFSCLASHVTHHMHTTTNKPNTHKPTSPAHQHTQASQA